MIDRLINTDKRRIVAWLGTAPPDTGRLVFERREFIVEACSSSQLRTSGYISLLAGVVFTQSLAKPLRITHELAAHAVDLLDYDCRVIIVPVVQPPAYPAFDGLSSIRNVISRLRLLTAVAGESGEPPLPHARVYPNTGNVQWGQAAHFVMEHPAGPAPSSTLVIEPEEVRQQLAAGYEILLRRAFWDCARLHLTRMDDGRSGVDVYLAHAELAKGQLGQWPLPYFLKIGDRDKVLDEYVNYEDNVDPYIPFHLGPHLIRERCCLGARVGVIVGDFVEESESLAECARGGRAGPAIACLFNRTLAGWHRVAEQDTQASSSLGSSLLRFFPGMRNKLEPRLARARQFGAMKTFDELRDLFRRCDSTPVLMGLIHGDLHAGNVRVRATDAIVIDFFRHDRGPLVCDPASLEASLLVDGFSERDFGKPKSQAELDANVKKWLVAIEPLYNHMPLHASLIHPNPKDPTCWFHACVRQIRRYALEMESKPGQYAAALALVLLTKATKDLEAPEPEASRRAAAYVMAERVLVSAFGSGEGEYCI